MKEPVSVSIVVPTYNQAEVLKGLLASLEALQAHRPFEVLIVDDASVDHTREVVETWLRRGLPFGQRYLRLEKNSGPGGARNAGARAAAGDIVAFTDSDCRVDPHWLEHLVRGIHRDKNVIGAGGHVLPAAQVTPYARYMYLHRVLDPPPNLQYLVTCNCAIVRECFLEVGGFPEDLPMPGGEDIELSIQLWKRGGRFAFVPDALIHHEHRDTLRSFVRTWRNYGYGTGLATHRTLDSSELAGRPSENPNYWSIEYVLPLPRGRRVIWGAFKYHLAECRGHRFGPRRTLETLSLWAIERLAYGRGWRQGQQAAQRQKCR
ncbi:MAG: glycosyltransferase [Candidatus Hydrogenedentes bacterium]|nr:glycosyltransferase [Candidatus Hydrogenedentota bacterium]MBI3118107.1 glycosyltransferase [Candidatus Hydrogenedentota bacterium]